MFHRHLHHDELTAAAIDDIIERGKLPDWVRLARAVQTDTNGKIAATVRDICARRHADRLAPQQSLAFWQNYIEATRQ